MMDKQQLLSYLENKLYIRAMPSETHGIGVFAIRDIPQGVDPFQSGYEEDTIEYTKDELSHLPPKIMKMIEDYCAEDQGKYHLPTIGFNPIDIARFINHAEDPNVKVDEEGWQFVTTRPIKDGEELFVDYHTYYDNVHRVLSHDRNRE